MNIFIVMAFATAGINLISAILLIYAAINVRKVSVLQRELGNQLRDALRHQR